MEKKISSPSVLVLNYIIILSAILVTAMRVQNELVIIEDKDCNVIILGLKKKYFQI